MKVKHNFKKKQKEFEKYVKSLSGGGKNFLKAAMFASLEEIGNIATQDYIDIATREEGEKAKAFAGRVTSRATGNKLRDRSGRLTGSIVGSWRFGGLPGEVKGVMRTKKKAIKGVKESIRRVSGSGGKITGEIGTKVEYAEIHEFGGTTHPKVTSKSRAFFWHMFFETQDDKWKGMALTSKDSFDVVLKKRPYLNPAARDAMPIIDRIFKVTIEKTFKNANI